MSKIELIRDELEYLQTHFEIHKGLDNTVALDIETSAKPEYEDLEKAALNYFTGKIDLIGIVGKRKGELVIDQFDANDFTRLSALLRQFIIDGITLTGHNTKFDLKYMIHNNIITYEEACQLWQHDSSCAAAVDVKKIPYYWLEKYEASRKIANRGRKTAHRQARGGSLKTLAPYNLGVQPFWEAVDHNNDKYNLLDCLYTYYLTSVLLIRIEGINGMQCYGDLIERSKLLMQAELEGIKLNIPETNRRLKENEVQLKELENKIRQQWSVHFDAWEELQRQDLREVYMNMCKKAMDKDKKGRGFGHFWINKYEPLFVRANSKLDTSLNIDSTFQLTWLLRDRLGYDITGLDGEEAVDKEVLSLIHAKHPEVVTLIEYKKHKKLQSTYYPNLVNFAKFDGRVHCGFNVTGAITGRLSSSAPNLQNQPGHLHDLFIAETGNKLITKDLGALEPVLIAYFSEDENLIDIVMSGKSFHSVNAKNTFDLDCEIDEVAKKYPRERRAAKEFGLSVLYGAGANRVKQSLMKYGYNFTVIETKRMIEHIRGYFKGVWNFKKQIDKLGESGEIIYNYLNRPVLVQDKDDVYMTLFNSLIQGSGSDILLQSSVDLIKENPWIKPRLWVHDELIIEVPEERAQEAEKLIEYHMTKYSLTTRFGNVKLSVEGKVGDTWEK